MRIIEASTQGYAMQRTVWWLIALVGLALIGLVIYNALRPPAQPIALRPASPVEPLRPTEPAEPQIRHPVPAVQMEKPLPALDTSDSTMNNALAELMPDNAFLELAVLKDFVRRVVATVDNLPRREVALRVRVVKPVPGQFKVSGSNENAAIAEENAARYTKYVRLAEMIDSAKLAAFYFHYYPLFQQAYRDLGYPKRHFNDRLVEVIDDLLAAPELQGAVALVRPKVLYLYADPDLESRSAGQKVIMRMGAQNAARIKTKLRELRAQLVRRGEAAAKSN